MLQPRAVKCERAKQSTKRSACVGFHLEHGATGRARGTCVNKAPYGRTLQHQPLYQGPARCALEAYVPRLITRPSS